jgi:hypothetical protein
MRAECRSLRRIAALDQKTLRHLRLLDRCRCRETQQRLRPRLQSAQREAGVRPKPGHSLLQRIGGCGTHISAELRTGSPRTRANIGSLAACLLSNQRHSPRSLVETHQSDRLRDRERPLRQISVLREEVERLYGGEGGKFVTQPELTVVFA